MQGRYKNEVNRSVIYTNYEWAFQSYYTDNINAQPTATQRNPYLFLISSEPGTATVDWGDGNVEDFQYIQLKDGRYICMFRVLISKSYKGNAERWPYSDINGNEIIPYPNHKYSSKQEHKITMTCSNNISAYHSVLIKMCSFPLLEMPKLTSLRIEYTSNIKEIPIDRISNLKKLISLVLISLGSKLQVIPSSLFELEDLTTLSLSGILNLENPDSSNLRLISKLKNLTSVDLSQNNLTVYVKEFNELANLKSLNISSRVNATPSYSEVDQINQSLASYTNLSEVGSRSEFDDLTGKKADKIAAIDAWSSWALDVTKLPNYWLEMRSVTSLNFGQSLTTQKRADDFVNSFYKLVIEWAQINYDQTAKDNLRNQFYGLSVTIYSAVYKADQRPTGIYQPTAGFVKGSANGNPTTPMEKIYVLTNNFAQKWTVRPENTKRMLKVSFVEGQYLDDSVVYIEKGPIFNNEIKSIEDI